MKLYKTTDRIPVKIGEITFWLSPMKWEHKILVANAIKTKSGDTHVTASQAKVAIKYCLKKVDGLQNHDGTELVLDMDAEGVLTDDAVEDVLLLESVPSLVTLALSWINGPTEIDLDGVTVDFSGTVSSIKKKI